MSALRPELGRNLYGHPVMSNGTAYLMILSAVRMQRGLIHGQLHQAGAHCAIGSYFTINRRTALPESLVDEVAAVNDSVPNLSARQRKAHVVRWLRWKLTQLGMPGFKLRQKIA